MTFDECWDILKRELGTDTAARACHALMREAGGESLYIPRRQPAPAVQPTETVRQVQQRAGVSRATAYRWVNAWKR